MKPTTYPIRFVLWTLGASLLLTAVFVTPTVSQQTPASQEAAPDTTPTLEHETFHRKLDMARDDLVLGALDEAERRLDEINDPIPEGYPTHRLAMLRGRIAMERGLGTRALQYLDAVPETPHPR